MSLLSIHAKHTLLREMPELQMHKKLKILFERIYPNRQVYIGQGSGEFGKDLVIIENDPVSGRKVTALVVKMGDLKGNADNRMLSTINTQITQAFTVPTYFKEISDSVVANDVIVVIFGIVSQNANASLKGLLSNSQKPVQTKNIEEMTKLFEKYYDDVFIPNGHIEVLHKKYEALNAVLLEKNKFLAQCYIDPNLKSFENTKKNIVIAQNKDTLSSETIKETIYGKKDTIASIYEKTSNHKHSILIQGEAGCGKSIFSIKFIQHAIQHIVRTSDGDLDSKIPAPILLKATKLKQLTKETLQQVINNYYSDVETNIVPNILLIDGIDEVSEVDRSNIIALSEEYCLGNRISLMVTSRKNQDIIKELPHFSYYEILPLELSQAIEFIKRMAGKNQTLIKGLLKNIEELQHQIPMSAMSLALLVEIAEKHNEIPASITELYDRYINMVVGVDNRDMEINQLFEPRYKIDFLMTISYELFYKNDDSIVTKEDFYSYLDDYTKRHSHISSKDDFLRDLKRVSILTINDDSVTFSHKSFLDYFIAKYFARNTEELFRSGEFDRLYSLYYTALWEDVTQFYFGFKNAINHDQIDMLIAHNPFADDNPLMHHIYLYSIGRLLQYAWNTDTSVKKYGIGKAISNMYALRNAADAYNKQNFGFNLPRVFADATLMHYTDFYFSSHFLQKEIIELMDDNFALLDISNGKVDISNEIYFFGLYILTNSKKIESSQIEKFISHMHAQEEKIDPITFYPIMSLFQIFVKSTGILISEDKKSDLEKISKTFRRKYKEIFEENYLFKNRIEARRFKNLTHKK